MAAEYAARYARALLDALEGQKADVEAAAQQLGDFKGAWDESAELRAVFLDPSFSIARKVELLDKLNSRLGMSQPVRNLLAVVMRHERVEGLDAIVAEFDRMVRGDLGIDKVIWTSARPLGEDEKRAVEQRIAELTGKRIEVEFVADAALLVGARLQVGSVVYDGSVRGRLDGLREKLVAG